MGQQMTDADVYIKRVYEKRTYKSLGEEYGLTEQGAYQAVMREKRRQRKLTPFYPNGVLVDPDGIGEFEDEWTVEEMYKNMFDTVFDS